MLGTIILRHFTSIVNSIEGPGGEGGGSGSEEGSGATLALDETFDAVRGGARLILNYDAASNAFTGTVENITNNVLSNVRIEVHLSNGTEIGPTTPVNLTPGQALAVNLPATHGILHRLDNPRRGRLAVRGASLAASTVAASPVASMAAVKVEVSTAVAANTAVAARAGAAARTNRSRPGEGVNISRV